MCIRRLLVVWSTVVVVLASAAVAANAATVLPGFSDQLFTSGLNRPTAMAFAPDGRLFIAEQGGSLRVVKNRVLLSAPFVRLTVDASGERGLLGIAFDPDFASNRYVYVYHTVPGSPARNRVTRFTANGDTAVPGSGRIILNLDPLNSRYHNGGAIHFGPGRKLYVFVGDNVRGANAQSLTTRLGKVLRINKDGSIPADNPTSFAGLSGTTSGVNRSIWAVGLRNPFTAAFQPGTLRLFINDVGQDAWEEINLGRRAANYGWPATEGPTTNRFFTSPVHAYHHGDNDSRGCAISGGTFYNPAIVQFPSSYVGKYFYADLCRGWIHYIDAANPAAGPSAFASGIAGPVDLKVNRGMLYYLARNGTVGRIRYTGS